MASDHQKSLYLKTQCSLVNSGCRSKSLLPEKTFILICPFWGECSRHCGTRVVTFYLSLAKTFYLGLCDQLSLRPFPEPSPTPAHSPRTHFSSVCGHQSPPAQWTAPATPRGQPIRIEQGSTSPSCTLTHPGSISDSYLAS